MPVTWKKRFTFVAGGFAGLALAAAMSWAWAHFGLIPAQNVSERPGEDGCDAEECLESLAKDDDECRKHDLLFSLKA